MMVTAMALRSRRLTSFVLAVLLLAGASAQALSALLCETGFCGQGCGMAAAEAPKESGCCPESKPKPEPKQEEGCCCRVESAPDATTPSPLAVAIPVFEIPFELAPTATLPLMEFRLVNGPIFGFTDPSPPPEPADIDRGRAPPSA